jgi:uncharacterized membrane protein YeaQ/YmgE (transglycosylase-associated protein family)
MNLILLLMVGGLTGYLAGLLPFVKSIGIGLVAKNILNIVLGLLAGLIIFTIFSNFDVISILLTIISAAIISTIGTSLIGSFFNH